MSDRFDDMAVPFKMVGNRRCLTAAQLAEHSWLEEFIRMFPDSFEQDPISDRLWFIEPDEP